LAFLGFVDCVCPFSFHAKHFPIFEHGKAPRALSIANKRLPYF
jgi:hypothetical protein